MGNARFDTVSYASLSNNRTMYAGADGTLLRKSVNQVFTETRMKSEFDPKNIKVRESRDSDANPTSRAMIVGLDVTGSMGFIPSEMANNQLGSLMHKLEESGIIPDPHLMFMFISDAAIPGDPAPLQVAQFEADAEILMNQLTGMMLTRAGGGNHYESYHLAWLAAGYKTSIDCFEKRKQKGILITIGDEEVPQNLTEHEIRNVIGDGQYTGETKELLKLAQKSYEVFHIIVQEGDYYKRSGSQVDRSWYNLLGNRAILLDNHKNISEVIMAIVAVSDGRNPDEVIESFDNPDVQKSVKHALYGLSEKIGSQK